jgi:hypothetical protein
MLTLYRRVRAYRALPEAGGLLDQNEHTMMVLDTIHDELHAGPDAGGGKILEATGTLANRRA